MDNCIHYWKIERVEGLLSTGTCSRCGEVKEFLNSIDDFTRTRGWNQAGFTKDKQRKENE